MGYDVKRFTNLEGWEDVICSICMGVFEEPLTTKCRHTFCKDCIHQWCLNNKTCPLDQLPIMDGSELVPAPLCLKNLMGRLKLYCAYQEHGCREIVKLEDLSHHQSVCDFRPRRMENTLMTNISKFFHRMASPFRRHHTVIYRHGTFNVVRSRPNYRELVRQRLEREDDERRERMVTLLGIVFIILLLSAIISALVRLIYNILENVLYFLLLEHTSSLIFVIFFLVIGRNHLNSLQNHFNGAQEVD